PQAGHRRGGRRGLRGRRGVRAGVHPRAPRAGPGRRPGPAGAQRRQPLLLGHGLPPGPPLRDGPDPRARRPGAAARALLSRTRPRPAGVDRPLRTGAARRRQPRAVPGNGARHRVPPRHVGEPGPQAHPRPGWQRRAPAYLPARRSSRRRAGDGAGDKYNLSTTGYHFIGGLLAHLPALAALTCGSANSYRRLAPQMWSSAYTVYGMDNREAAVRICSPMSDDKAASVNLELKPSDSSANPYLALGAVIHAGLDGIRRKLDPGESVNVDPAVLTDAERLARGPHRLPDSLGAALDCLEADTLLMDSLGDLRRRAYLAVKRSEAAEFADMTTAQECFEHFTKI